MEFPDSLPPFLTESETAIELKCPDSFLDKILHPLVFFKIDISLATLFLAVTQPIKWTPSTCYEVLDAFGQLLDGATIKRKVSVAQSLCLGIEFAVCTIKLYEYLTCT